ncbi:DNA-directed DNA polymerase gamma mip1, partial [Coemansia sp. Cherry 401B]
MQSGWTRYADGGASRVRVPAREDGVLVLDVEVLVPESPYPVLAAAVSQRAWYLWVSPHLAGDSAHPRHLIPLTDPDEAERPRLVIGHSVGYDRARIQDERRLRRGQLAFVDTMSLHVAGRGLCTRQRPQWQRYARARRENDAEYLRVNSDTGRIFDVSSLNSLREVARHYCGLELSKERRSVFVEGSLREVRARFAALADYCARDVDATRRVFAHVLPAFRRKCPHAASFAGALAMLEAYLPVDGAWPAYVARSERLLGELSESVARRMRELAEDARRAGGPQDDAWLRCLDWTAEAQRFTKPRLRRDGSYAKGGAPRPVARQRLAGAPKWYRDLWDAKRGRIHVTVRSRVAPYLLKLRWRGFPLYYSAAHGWTFRVPAAEARSTESDGTQPPLASLRALRFARDADDPAYEPIPARDADGVYFKVPHPDGDAARCGSPL